MEDGDEPPVKKQKIEIELTEIKNNEDDFTDDMEISDKFSQGDKYDNFVSPAELERLREFKVLDEVKSNDEDSNDEDSDSSDAKSEGVPEEEIEKMLEEDLPEGFKGVPKPKEKPYVTRQKIVLEEKGINHFEVLPLDWMMVRHYSGMPVYIHRSTRVCTLSKPYFLGKGNTRRHDIPISAIPCLAYRKALVEEEKQTVIDKQIEEQIKNGTWQKTAEQNNQINRFNLLAAKVGLHKPHTVDNISKCPIKQVKGSGKLSKPVEYITENDTSSNHLATPNDETTNEHHPKEALETSENLQSSKKNDDLSKSKECNEVTELDVNSELNVVPNNLNIGNKSDGPISDRTVETQDKPVSERKKKKVSDNPTTKPVSENVCDNPTTDGTEQRGLDNPTDLNTVEIPLNRQPVVLPGGIVMPPPRVETVGTSWKTQHLTHEQVNDYCKALFKFKTVNIMHFMRWADRRKYTKARKTLQYPTLPEGTKLITIPAQSSNNENGGGKVIKRDWVMNMKGGSYLSVFHEYVTRALQKQPVYEFKQLENAATPYQATVFIGGMQYGVGHGSSKRAAKSAAARASMHILIPEMRNDLDREPASHQHEPDFTFFDYVGIEDPRITEFCAATCEPSPHAILRTCLLRNFGAGDKHINTEMKKLEYQQIELTMKVGKHTATVVCKNKKTAKQRASQAILQALHPHVRSWGSLLRLYGSRSVKSCKEKKLEEQQITLLQDAARHNEPNYAVLEKLRHEMRKLRERDEAVVPIGTLLVKDDLPTHSGSNLNNVDL